MLKTSKIIPLFISILLFLTSCVTVPDGEPPKHAVEILTSDVNGGKISMSEAVNLASTELAVKVFSGHRGEIKLLFKDKPSERDAVRRLYQELNFFLPVKSVAADEDFVIESVFATASDSGRLWQLKLKDKNGNLVWCGVYYIKDGEKI